jgi:hypothetical protein
VQHLVYRTIDGQPRHWDRFRRTELAMKAIVIIGIVLVVAVTFGTVWQDLDPLYPILMFVLPHFILNSTVIFYTLRIGIVASIVCESYPTFTVMYLSALTFLVSFKEIISKAIDVLKNRGSQWNSDEFRFLRSSILLRNIEIFRLCQIYTVMNRPAYCWGVPIMIFSGSTLLVISNCITIKLYSTLGMPLYLAGPFLSAAACVLTVVAVPAATSIFDQSEESTPLASQSSNKNKASEEVGLLFEALRSAEWSVFYDEKFGPT